MNTAQAVHTPLDLPLEVHGDHMFGSIVLAQERNGARVIVFQGDKATAEFIVRAVNSHAELVQTVRDMRAAIGTYCPRENGKLHPALIAAHDAATAALAKAEVQS